MRTIQDFNFKNRKALIRVDFNVPLDKSNQITDSTRIDAALPTIKKILNDGGSVVLMSHLGRPLKKLNENGTINIEKFTLRNIIPYLSKVLQNEVLFAEDCISENAFQLSNTMKQGEVLLLENTRFYAEEEKGNEEFAKKLSKHGDIYVNDAFGTAHRAHASTTIVAHFFDEKCFGALMAKEIENANKAMKAPQRPFTAVLGGAKVSDKILLIENLLNKADNIIIGGGMAYTFFKALNYNIGNSLVETDKLELAKNLLEKAKEKNVNILLPTDSIIADKFEANANTKNALNINIESDWMGLDIGEKAIEEFVKCIHDSKTILWNGPMGVFEMEKFQNGTKSVALAVADATSKGAFSIVGGGDSVAAVKLFHIEDKVSFVSTGGGAMLEYFEGKELPGIKAII
jgi:phosphoglycerate kinase